MTNIKEEVQKNIKELQQVKLELEEKIKNEPEGSLRISRSSAGKPRYYHKYMNKDTVHKAKGLEYGCVIMPYMGMDIASMKKADLDMYVENEKLAYGIRIGDEPNKKYNSNYDVSQEQNERVNEESRVLYVALTRAIRNVVWMKDIKSKSKISWQNLRNYRYSRLLKRQLRIYICVFCSRIIELLDIC